jgi:hypothetical protein
VVVRDSGFTFQSSGVYYGNMCNSTGVAGVRFENCYPRVAFSTSKLAPQVTVSPLEYVERVSADAFPPAGWTAGGVTTGCTRTGGSLGATSVLRFTGDVGSLQITKRYTLREQVEEIGAVFITFLARGDGGLLCSSRTNGDAASFTSTVNSTNIGRYSNSVISLFVDSATTYKRFLFVIKPNAVNYPFDNIDFFLGRQANASAGTFIDIKDIRVGYLTGSPDVFNPF